MKYLFRDLSSLSHLEVRDSLLTLPAALSLELAAGGLGGEDSAEVHSLAAKDVALGLTEANAVFELFVLESKKSRLLPGPRTTQQF